MSLRYGVVVANVTEETQQFWIRFKQESKRRGMSYTSALEQAARLWMERPQPTPGANPFAWPASSSGEPFHDPAPIRPEAGLDD